MGHLVGLVAWQEQVWPSDSQDGDRHDEWLCPTQEEPAVAWQVAAGAIRETGPQTAQQILEQMRQCGMKMLYT